MFTGSTTPSVKGEAGDLEGFWVKVVVPAVVVSAVVIVTVVTTILCVRNRKNTCCFLCVSIKYCGNNNNVCMKQQ